MTATEFSFAGDTMTAHTVAVESLRQKINQWFKRRPTTRWSDKEDKALKLIAKLGTDSEDLSSLDRYYNSGCEYLRRDVQTLLNNWTGEIDRARRWAESKPTENKPAFQPRPPTVHELKTVLEQKIALRNGIRERHSHEGPLGREYTNPERKAEVAELNKEIKELQARIANAV